jgi:uncharacterized RDD family membrane protein YckC
MLPDPGPNPYRSPQAELDVAPAAPSQQELAGRWARLGASLLDTTLQLLILLPVQYSYGVYDGFPLAMKPQSLPMNLAWGVFGFVLWSVIHGFFIARGGQTIGKRLLGLRVVTVSDGRAADFSRYVVLRALPLTAVSLVPYLGGVLALADALAIFRNDRRCLHDLIAGTRVVRA